MHPRAEEFAAETRERYGFDPEVREFPEGTETAADAAAAIGCAVAHIASSIAVRVDDELVVVITSGANRVDLDAVAALRGRDPGAASMADPDAVRGTLGWSIGGVPPFCHETEVPTYLDETLLSFEVGGESRSVQESRKMILLGVHPYDLVAINQVDELLSQVQ